MNAEVLELLKRHPEDDHIIRLAYMLGYNDGLGAAIERLNESARRRGECPWCGATEPCQCEERRWCGKAGQTGHMQCGMLPCGCPRLAEHRCPHGGRA